MTKNKQTPSIGGAKKPGPGIGIADAVAAPPPARARFAPIGTQDEQTEEGHETGRPRRDGARRVASS